MRVYRVVLLSGVSLDILAKAMIDDPSRSDDLLFFSDEARNNLVARVKRSELAGLILGQLKSSAFPQRQ